MISNDRIEQRERIISQYRRGVPPVAIAVEFGITSSGVIQMARRAGVPAQNPKMAENRSKRRPRSGAAKTAELERYKKRGCEMREMIKEARAGFAAAGMDMRGKASQIGEELDALIAAIPDDTRNLTARFCGDPLPGRSALDRRASA